MVKKCIKCGALKRADEFYRHAAMADGRLNKCIPCVKDYAAKRRMENPDKLRVYEVSRSKTPKRIALSKRVHLEWVDKNPEKRAAQVALGNAIRDGRVKKWPVCAMPECSGMPQAHHPDYSMPLDVVWLCPAHHKRLHAEHDKLRSLNVQQAQQQHPS